MKIIHRVLSFDGGGIRGLYQAKLLERFMERDLDLVSKADILAGTSTGAIVAAGLAVGMSPTQIATLYSQLGPKVFPKPGLMYRATKYIRRAPYSSTVLRAALEKSPLGKRSLGECQRRLIVAAMSLTTHTLHVFDSTDPSATATTLVDVLLASAAAPTYFEPAKVGDVYYADGGLCCNNPAFRAVSLLNSEDVPLDRIYVLSISTAGKPVTRDGAEAVGRSQLGWARPAIGLAMVGSSDVAARDCELAGFHGRIVEPLEEEIALDDYESAARLLPALAAERARDPRTLADIDRWLAGPPQTGDSFAGHWEGRYSWTNPEDGTQTDTPEILHVSQSGDLVYGDVESEWPYKFWGKVYGEVLIGEWAGNLRGSFFLTRNRETDQVAGTWVGMGHLRPYQGAWTRWDRKNDDR